MKKILLGTVIACLFATATWAAPRSRGGSRSETCHYSVLQQLIRDARSAEDLKPIIGGRVDLNAPVKCGGSVMQLAVRRGNSEIVKVLLENGASVQNEVSLKGFEIEGAPQKVSLLMFAGYYSPREDIVRLIISAGADVLATDSNGNNVLWYIEQNPVLRETALEKNIEQALLFGVGSEKTDDENTQAPVQAQPKMGAMNPKGNKQVPSARPPKQPLITKTAVGTVGIVGGVQEDAGSNGMQVGYQPVEVVEPDMPIIK